MDLASTRTALHFLLAEVEQRFVDDGTFHGMPYDFVKFMLPAARRDGFPIVGIDREAGHSPKADRWHLDYGAASPSGLAMATT